VFKNSVLYPSIPVFVDETTVYPLSGECTLTGAEYLTAVQQGAEIKINDIYYLPIKMKIHDPNNDMEAGSVVDVDGEVMPIEDLNKKMESSVHGVPGVIRLAGGKVGVPLSRPFYDCIMEIQAYRIKYAKIR
jgi:hypothetical protein